MAIAFHSTALHPITGPTTRPTTRPIPRPATACPARLRGSALAAAVLLSGCASPYVRLSPGSDTLDVQPQVLADAIGTARAKQREYHDQVINLGESERALSNSLLGLGTLVDLWRQRLPCSAAAPRPAAGGHVHRRRW